MGPLNLERIFAINDLTPLDRLIAVIDELDKTYSDLAKNASSNSDKFNKALESTVAEAAKLEKQIQTLDSSILEQQQTIQKSADQAEKLAAAQQQLKNAQAQNTAVLVEAKTQQEKLRIAREKATKATIEDRVAQQEGNKIARINTRLKKSQEGSIDQLRASLALTKIEWAKLSKEERENTVAGQRLSKQLKELNDDLKKQETAVGITSRSVGDYTNSIVDAFSKLGPLNGATSGFGSALTGVVGNIPQIAALGAVVGGVGAAMDQLQELTEEVKVELKAVSDLTGETGDNLLDLTANIRATSQTFDQEFNEVLRAGNVLSKEFGLSQQEALDIINEGFVRGANAGGDLLDQIREYSVQFKAAGLDARNLLNVIDTSVEQGIFSDKGADLIKEAGLRLRELTPAAQDALKPLGELTNQQIRAAVASGNTFEAIKLVADGIGNINLSAQEVQTVIADVFGGPGEDAGLRFIELLGDIDQGFKLTEESATDFQKSQLELLAAQQELTAVQVELGDTLSDSASGYKTFGLNVQAFAIKFIIILLDVLRPVRDLFGEVADELGELTDALGITSSEGEKTVGVLDLIKVGLQLLLFPLRILLTIFTSIVSGFTELINGFSDVDDEVKETTESVSVFQQVIENTPFLLSALLAAVKAAFSGIRELAVETFGNLADIIQGSFTLDLNQLASGLQGFSEPFKTFGKDVSDAFFNTFKSEREAALKEQEGDIAESNERVLQEQRKFSERATKEQIEANKKRAEEIRKATFELNKFRIEQEIRTLEEIASNEDLILASRLEALSDAADKRIELARLERDELLRQENLTQAGRTLILEQFAAKVQEIEDETTLEIDATIKLDADRTEQEFRDALDATLEERLANQDIDLSNRLTALNEALRKEEISIVEFEQRRAEIEAEFARKRLEDQLAFLQNQLQLLDLSKEERLAIEREIAAVQLQLSDQTNAQLIENERQFQESINQLKKVAFDAALAIIDNFNVAQDERRAIELEKLEVAEEAELERAGDNEEKRAEVEAKFAEERAKIEQEQRAADRRRAIFEKALAATQIGVQTAVAVARALANPPGPPFSIPQAVVAGSLGAIQLAAVLSQPIPAFEKGTKSAPGGYAIINEKGPEAMIDPYSGKVSMFNTDGPTFTYIPKGTEIIPADQTAERFLENERYVAIDHTFKNDDLAIQEWKQEDQRRAFESGLGSKIDQLNSTVKNKKESHLNISKWVAESLTQQGYMWHKKYNEKYG